VTLATLPHLRAVSDGEMVGTVKIIPSAVEEPVLSAAVEVARTSPMRLHPYRPRRIVLVSTALPGFRPSVIVKMLRDLEGRLRGTGSVIASDVQVPHEIGAVEDAIRRLAPTHDLLVVFGATAIADCRDVIPAALEMSGAGWSSSACQSTQATCSCWDDSAARPSWVHPGAPGARRRTASTGCFSVPLADAPVTAAEVRRFGTGGLLHDIGVPSSKPVAELGTVPRRAMARSKTMPSEESIQWR